MKGILSMDIATDGVNTGKDTSNGNFTIIQTNVAPILDFIGNKSVQVNSTLTTDINATDADNDTLVYAKNVSFGTIDSSTGIFTWTPDAIGNYTVNFTVSDDLAQDSEIINLHFRFSNGKEEASFSVQIPKQKYIVIVIYKIRSVQQEQKLEQFAEGM
ncbi:MAG: putative Ig domain-containing protein [Candidatus Aenigmarchaeota archaeon]|nr:putative Ig domain-containing protein [Candidatus Aenigmarchaeota archaeon]